MEDEEISAENIRVITVLGHVDHGKTTFVDSLLAANNIISARMAGKIRYMDSREDEQERGITMESSAVSLRFTLIPDRSNNPEDSSAAKTYAINLVDTPGHVDFSTEVSTASRLCDGGLLMLDVVEGVCTQTITVLHQIWEDRIRPILVLNKLDRLITELKLTPSEAYSHLSRLLEQVNAVLGSLYAGEKLEDDYRWREEIERKNQSIAEQIEASLEAETQVREDKSAEEKDDEDLYFSPARGNVIFASAVDGWGFRIGSFSRIFAARLGVRENLLRSVLWGNYYFEPKSKRIIAHRHLRGRNLKPLFVQLILENIWSVYEGVLLHPDKGKVEKIVSSLKLAVAPKDLASKDARHVLSSIFSRWLPLASTTIQAVVEVVPSPPRAHPVRLPYLLHRSDFRVTQALQPPITPRKVDRDMFSCDSRDTACVVAYVSKLFAVPYSKLSPHLREYLSTSPPAKPESNELILGFARLFSGTLRQGAFVYAILPKYDHSLLPSDPFNLPFVKRSRITGLFKMMGRDLIPTKVVRAGNVFAVAGIHAEVLRDATLCAVDGRATVKAGGDESTVPDQSYIVNLANARFKIRPFVRIALEPKQPEHMSKLVEGLRLLSQADPCVETFQQQNGEHVIVTAGELHFERCLKDLEERFAGVPIQASKPIVPFRETVAQSSGKNSRVQLHKRENDYLRLVVGVERLPDKLKSFLKRNATFISEHSTKSRPFSATRDVGNEEIARYEGLEQFDQNSSQEYTNIAEFRAAFSLEARNLGVSWRNDIIWAFGPGSIGPNVLVDARKHKIISAGHSSSVPTEQLIKDLEDGLEIGFQMATFQGPLCGEPLEGVAFIVEEVYLDVNGLEMEEGQIHRARLSGSCISGMKDACHEAIMQLPLRIMLAVYSCEIQASSDVLGKVYGVVSRRHGRIISEDVHEGTGFFLVRAFLPVVESFGFALEIRKRTSGAAHPQLVFGGYETLDIDPFWVPSTEEELEDLGEKSDRLNLAKGYIDSVREKKGLFVDRKIISSAEKQRTLKR